MSAGKTVKNKISVEKAVRFYNVNVSSLMWIFWFNNLTHNSTTFHFFFWERACLLFISNKMFFANFFKVFPKITISNVFSVFNFDFSRIFIHALSWFTSGKVAFSRVSCLQFRCSVCALYYKPKVIICLWPNTTYQKVLGFNQTLLKPKTGVCLAACIEAFACYKSSLTGLTFKTWFTLHENQSFSRERFGKIPNLEWKIMERGRHVK